MSRKRPRNATEGENSYLSDLTSLLLPEPEDDEGGHDFSRMKLKPDHERRPLWVLPTGKIYLEAFSPLAKRASDFLVTVSEPVRRPEIMHEYRLTINSLFAAVSVGMDTESILRHLDIFSKCPLPLEITEFVRKCAERHGRVKLVLKDSKYFVESSDDNILRALLENDVISHARRLAHRAEAGHVVGMADTTEDDGPDAGLEVVDGALAAAEQRPGFLSGEGNTTQDTHPGLEEEEAEADGSGILQAPAAREVEPEMYEVEEEELKAQLDAIKASANERTYRFRVAREHYEDVRRTASDMQFPMMEEYDFKADRVNRELKLDLLTTSRMMGVPVNIRPYQAKALNKVFGNGRARSGIIVLPCGAGKTLVGVTAAATVKKSCVVLTTSDLAVHQWKSQFLEWTSIHADRIVTLTSGEMQRKEARTLQVPNPGVVISTYQMLTFGGRRAEHTQRIMDQIRGREWGMLIFDEVHLAPANTFRRAVDIVRSHSKLGLTATLVREDKKIDDLFYLIGPKLYEANWMELTAAGYLANVKCVEVQCPMAQDFMAEYLDPRQSSVGRRLLQALNPNKFQVCDVLVQYHMAKNDRIIIFGDSVFALKKYQEHLGVRIIHGGVPKREREEIISGFKNDTYRCIILSRVGDNALDIPAANVLIQFDFLGGAQRQEAQRLGRILRPKRGMDPSIPHAFFYSLLSGDTKEMFHGRRRQEYLVNQGYSFSVSTMEHILGSQKKDGRLPRSLTKRTEQRDLLSYLLEHIEDAKEEDVAESAALDRSAGGEGRPARPAARRTTGKLAAASGAGTSTYQEIRA